MPPTLLVIDDEETIRRSLRHFFSRKGYRLLEAETGAAGLAQVQDQAPDLVLLDLKLPDTDGLTLLGRIREASPETAVIMVTARGSIESAVAAIKAGATDYLSKPVDLDEVDLLLNKTLEMVRLQRENSYLRSRTRGRNEAVIPGTCPAIRALNGMVDLPAKLQRIAKNSWTRAVNARDDQSTVVWNDLIADDKASLRIVGEMRVARMHLKIPSADATDFEATV